ncbi:MAG: hypothetical protein HY575_09400 [candidate division NC10 bacterium]|nr:hypothetical protein [candidate division NC10 bacterium]MBI4392091.1 hypothetical protein [candidate division NC10 bacterium]
MRERRIGSLSRLLPDGRAFSVQTIVLPEEAGSPSVAAAEAVAGDYFASLGRSGAGLLAVDRSSEAFALRLRGLRAPLLAFAPAGEVPEPDGTAVSYAITGGLLLRRGAEGGRLCFRLARTKEGLRVTVDLEAFAPALLALPGGRALCRFIQLPFHARAGRRFLRRLRRRPRLDRSRPPDDNGRTPDKRR